MDYLLNEKSGWDSTVSSPLDADYAAGQPAAAGITAQEVAAIVAQALASLRVYVVESDITDAQNSVKAVVEQSTF